jgi:2',3'-cyclic-nucleotide 2'-phosphodiesterase/3'-nucleotidase/5'-nucleotidase
MLIKMVAFASLLALIALLPRTGAAFEPVYDAAANTTLHAQVIGRFDGGRYLESAASTAPAYHPGRKWLYVISQWRYTIQVIEIVDLRRLRRVKEIGREDFIRGLARGSVDPDLIGEIESVAYSDGVLAVAFSALRENERGRVLFFDPDGDPIGDPVKVGVDPDAMAFTPDGSKLVLANTATAGDNDPEASITIIRVHRRSRHRVTTDVTNAGFSRFNGQVAQLRARGVRIFRPGATVAQDLEPETVAVAPDGSRAWVSMGRNNAIAEVDLVAETVTAIHGLSTRNMWRPGQGIDASDRDGRVNIRPWPLWGYYQPDGIGVFPAGNQLHLVTANEGDPRGDEAARIGSLRLDPEAFPQAVRLQRPENLGRLGVTRLEGDRDGDGDYDRLFLLGTRSFAVWTTAGQPLFDSGDAFERITARAVPTFFNGTVCLCGLRDQALRRWRLDE